jgi:DNA-binding FadR family transcriptional regulator
MSPRQVQARELLVRIDRLGRSGVGRQPEEQLRAAIRAGTLAPGSDLRSGRALAEDLAVSRGVVVRAVL